MSTRRGFLKLVGISTAVAAVQPRLVLADVLPKGYTKAGDVVWRSKYIDALGKWIHKATITNGLDSCYVAIESYEEFPASEEQEVMLAQMTTWVNRHAKT